MLAQLTTNGGVVMVTFVPGFVSQEVAGYNKLQTDERQAPRARTRTTRPR